MSLKNGTRFRSMMEFWEHLPEDQRIITDVLRQIILENLPPHCKEKLAYNVPFFYGKKGICLVWPAAVPRGGIKKGVLLGFWQGNKLKDTQRYLEHGTNKKIYYKIFYSVNDIDAAAIIRLLKEAVKLDNK